MNGSDQEHGGKEMDGEKIPAPEWHRHRADQERELADRSSGPDARDRHRRLANMHDRAADHGYELQMVEDR